MKTLSSTPTSTGACTSASPASADHINNLSHSQIAHAFHAWELDFRTNPESFWTKEEQANRGTEAIGESKASYFMELLRQAQAADDSLNSSRWLDAGQDLVGNKAGIGVPCIGVELHPLGSAPLGEIVRVNVHADHPEAFDLVTFAAGFGCAEPLIVGPMEFVTILKKSDEPPEVLTFKPHHADGLNFGIHEPAPTVVKQ